MILLKKGELSHTTLNRADSKHFLFVIITRRVEQLIAKNYISSHPSGFRIFILLTFIIKGDKGVRS